MDFNLVEERSHRRKLIALKSTQIFIVAAVILITLLITVLCIGFLVHYEVETEVWNAESVKYWNEKLPEEQRFWYNDGIEELESALKIIWERREYARNVLIVVTHGIDAAALAAARYNESHEGAKKMIWDDFAHVGRIMTRWNGTSQSDAHSLGTSLFGGVQTTQGIGGLDSAVAVHNCIQATNDAHQVKSILSMAQGSDFRNGFVTTRRVSAPLMASLYAHTADTDWECDAAVPASGLLQGCKDVATQLIDDETGIGMNVIMGGGRQALVSSVPISDWDPLDAEACNSRDGRNYIRDWRTFKRLQGQRNAVVKNFSELRKLNGSNVDFVMGIFANGNIKPPWEHTSTENSMPHLGDMVQKALDVLSRKSERFMLVVESGNAIGRDVGGQIEELIQLNATMDAAMRKLSDDTLLIVLFLEYGNGSGQNGPKGTGAANNSNKALPKMDSISSNIRILANGPTSYLFHGVHDETYLAHAISFALEIGPFRKPS